PEISTMGMQRAGDLNRFLNAEKIDRILVTKYRRTAMTGDSVRISKSIDTSIYPADRIGAGLQNRLKELPDSENHFLIIGHSNTIPGIIRSFGLHDFLLDELPDHVYDRLYIIRVRNET